MFLKIYIQPEKRKEGIPSVEPQIWATSDKQKAHWSKSEHNYLGEHRSQWQQCPMQKVEQLEKMGVWEASTRLLLRLWGSRVIQVGWTLQSCLGQLPLCVAGRGLFMSGSRKEQQLCTKTASTAQGKLGCFSTHTILEARFTVLK